MTIRWALNVYRPAIHLETVNRDKSRLSSPPRLSTVPVKTWESFSIWRHLDIFIPDFRIRQMIMWLPRLLHMEGGTAAMLTSSGQAANFFALFNICECGDHIVASSSIYGGTFNLIAVTLKKMGISATFVSPDATEEELNAAFQPNTKLMFGETIANPALTVLDIELFAKVAHAHGVPLIVDNTFPTPVNCRPIRMGCRYRHSLHHKIYGWTWSSTWRRDHRQRSVLTGWLMLRNIRDSVPRMKAITELLMLRNLAKRARLLPNVPPS